jgi:uncharacterized membrane protein YfcA
MFLEVATTIGALIGALIATHVTVKILSLILAIVLIYSAYLSQRPRLFPQIDGVENIEFDQKNSIGFGETNGQKKARYYPSQKSTSTANCYCYFQPTSYR